MRSTAVGHVAGICESCMASYDALATERQKRLREEFAAVNGDPLVEDE